MLNYNVELYRASLISEKFHLRTIYFFKFTNLTNIILKVLWSFLDALWP